MIAPEAALPSTILTKIWNTVNRLIVSTVYVLLVPWIGYLLATIAFCCVLSFRLGYRSARWMGIATVFAIATVVIFKGLLQVKIPAGEIYGLLPAGAFRSFMMTYL